MLNGSVRIAAVNEAGETFVDDVTAGDVWFFPKGVPHSIQAFEDGCEFLLVFSEGDFSEDNIFLVSELFERNPKEVLAKNFRTGVSTFDKLPNGQLWIFPGTAPPHDIKSKTSLVLRVQYPRNQRIIITFQNNNLTKFLVVLLKL